VKSYFKLQFWQPEKELGRQFVGLVWQRIERRQRWLKFWAGVRLALGLGLGLLAAIFLFWLAGDLQANGFFWTLMTPNLYLSLTGWRVALNLLPWENLVLVLVSFWLIELLIGAGQKGDYGQEN